MYRYDGKQTIYVTIGTGSSSIWTSDSIATGWSVLFREWWNSDDRKSEVIGTVWSGKSDLYHAFQATKIPYMPVDTSVAVNVQRNVHVEL